MEFRNKILQGHVLEVLRGLPDGVIDCIMTSPPYYGLRDYGDEVIADWGDWRGQLGLEPTYQMYLEHLWMIFDEIKRVLKKTGTCFVNIGDTYYGGGRNSGNNSGHIYKQHTQPASFVSLNWEKGFTAKTLIQIPSRFSIGMTERGWILRNRIIWRKKNCMPSSAKDRFTVDFEEIFFFVKNKKYWFEQQKEGNNVYETTARAGQKRFGGNTAIGNATLRGERKIKTVGRNKRCVWDVNTVPYRKAHFAVFPQKLIETPIKAGCPADGIVCDPFGGSGTVAAEAIKQGKNYLLIEIKQEYIEQAEERIEKAKKLKANGPVVRKVKKQIITPKQIAIGL